MIIVADFYRIGNEHVPVNAALLYMICKEYSNEEILFCAEKKHTEAISSFWSSNKLEIKNIIFHKHTSNLAYSQGIKMVLSRIRFELFAVRKLSKTLNKEQNAFVFFLSLSSITTVFQKLFFFKKTPAVITLHGDVEFIRLNNDFTRNFLGRCFRFSFRIKRVLCKYLVLDNVIKSNLIKSGLLNEGEIIAIPHPYIYQFPEKHIQYATPFKIGHIGVASVEKQAFYLFRIAEKFKDAIGKKQIEFSLIGRNENIDSKDLNEFVTGAQNKQMLSREDFETSISKLHYSIFFYNDIYQLTGSGAIQDAFNFEKPIIALKNELFNAIFERAGNIGFLCNDISEIEKILKQIITGEIDTEMYETMQCNMRTFKESNALHKIQKQLFSQLNFFKPAAEINRKHELV